MKTFTLVVTLVAGGVAQAASTQVGVIDFNKLFTETQRARVDRAELDRMMAARQKDVDARKAAIEEARATLASTKKNLDAMARAKKQAEIDAAAGELRKLFEDAQAQLVARERELSKKVLDDARAMAPEIARTHGLSIVLGAAEALLWAAPSVVQVDLTEEIARALDRKIAAPLLKP
jgi:Skp family chaperone for outer membrane proteins